MPEPLDRRQFLAGSAAALAAAAATNARDREDGPHLTHGPFVTRNGKEWVEMWARASEPGRYRVRGEGAVFEHEYDADAVAERDLTLLWSFDLKGLVGPLKVLDRRDRVLWTEDHGEIQRASRGPGSSVVLGSCADDRSRSDQPVWDRIRDLDPALVAFLGDTPYIDSTDLETQRARYRAFRSQPQLARLLRATPFVGTWDDHDYAGNGLFGSVEGRAASRKAFLEYHGGGFWGRHGEGIFTRRSLPGIDLFLLDTRWFADTEPSPFDASKRSLLGAKQWNWLRDGLRTSRRPLKVLASGMVWHDRIDAAKRDAWRTWSHERAALFEWLGRERISGVVLASGDLHRSQAVRHATKDVVGYDVIELVTSPLAAEALGGPGTAGEFLFDAAVEHAFARISAESRPDGGFTASLELRGGDACIWRADLGPTDLSRA